MLAEVIQSHVVMLGCSRQPSTPESITQKQMDEEVAWVQGKVQQVCICWQPLDKKSHVAYTWVNNSIFKISLLSYNLLQVKLFACNMHNNSAYLTPWTKVNYLARLIL